MQIVNSELKSFNMIILDVVSVFSSILVLYRREVRYKAGRCFNFSFYSSLKPKRAAILFYKNVVPLNF